MNERTYEEKVAATMFILGTLGKSRITGDGLIDAIESAGYRAAMFCDDSDEAMVVGDVIAAINVIAQENNLPSIETHGYDEHYVVFRTITGIHTKGDHAIVLFSDGVKAFLPPAKGRIAMMRPDGDGYAKGWWEPGTPPSPILPMTDEESDLLEDYLSQIAQTPTQTLNAVTNGFFDGDPPPRDDVNGAPGTEDEASGVEGDFGFGNPVV